MHVEEFLDTGHMAGLAVEPTERSGSVDFSRAKDIEVSKATEHQRRPMNSDFTCKAVPNGIKVSHSEWMLVLFVTVLGNSEGTAQPAAGCHEERIPSRVLNEDRFSSRQQHALQLPGGFRNIDMMQHTGSKR